MITATILLNTHMGAEKEVAEKLRTVNGVTEAYSLYGVYDVAVKLHAPNMSMLKDTITHQIMKIPGTLSILTLVTAEKDQHSALDMFAFVNPTVVATC